MKKALAYCFALSLLVSVSILFPSPTFAARSLTTESNKSSLFGEEEMIITASASGFTSGETIYIKGAFYKEGSTNYFGYTKKDSTWIKNGETTTSQKSIVVGSWDGKLDVKSDFADSGYQGEGDYKFKVGFYYTTSGGNLFSVNWSDNVLSMVINEPNYTSTPTPSPANTPTPTSTPKPTATHTPTPTPTKAATPTVTIEPTSDDVLPTAILGESTSLENTPSPTTAVKNISGSPNPLPAILIGIGTILLAVCGILAFQEYKKSKQGSML